MDQPSVDVMSRLDPGPLRAQSQATPVKRRSQKIAEVARQIIEHQAELKKLRVPIPGLTNASPPTAQEEMVARLAQSRCRRKRLEAIHASPGAVVGDRE